MSAPVSRIESSRTADAPEYRRVAREVLQLLAPVADLASASPSRRLVVGVAGETGSGKSTTAVAIARELEAGHVPAAVLHQDDYFLRPPLANHRHREHALASVGPQEVDLARLATHVARFRAGDARVPVPIVDYPTDTFLTRTMDFAPLGVLLVEGTYVLELDGLEGRVFLAATHQDTAERRRARNRDVDAPFVQQVLAIEHDLVSRYAARAHVLVERDFTVRPGPAA